MPTRNEKPHCSSAPWVAPMRPGQIHGRLLTYTVPLHKLKLLLALIDALRSHSWNILCRTGVSQRRHERKQRLNSEMWPRTAAKNERRYSNTAQTLHWVSAALMFAVLPIAWVMVNMPKTAHARGALFTLHKSIGLTILMLAVIRLVWRARHPAPSLAGCLCRWQQRIAVVSHWMLYAMLIGMPVSGYLLDATGGHPISYFGIFSVPVLSKSPTMASAATWAHVAFGQWLVYALIFLHASATAWHVVVRRDGVLNSMLPKQVDHVREPHCSVNTCAHPSICGRG